MDYFNELKRKYPLPDFSRLWALNAQDQTDSQTKEIPFVLKFERYIVAFQELALWTDPRSTLIALGLVHLTFAYFYLCSMTALNLTAWALLGGFIYTTWTQRIWPVIRVNPTEDELAEAHEPTFTPLNPDCVSGPEAQELVESIKKAGTATYLRLKALRAQQPAKFCVLSCFVFSSLALLGSLCSTLSMLYFAITSSLVLPGLVLKLRRENSDFDAWYKSAIEFIKSKVVTSEDTIDGNINSCITAQKPKVQEVETAQEPPAKNESSFTLSSLAENIAEKSGTAAMASAAAVGAAGGSFVGAITSVIAGKENEEDDSDPLEEYLPKTEDQQRILNEAEADSEEEDREIQKESLNDFASGLDSIPGVEEEESVKEEVQSVERTASPVTADENDEFLPKSSKVIKDDISSSEDEVDNAKLRESISTENKVDIPPPPMSAEESSDDLPPEAKSSSSRKSSQSSGTSTTPSVRLLRAAMNDLDDDTVDPPQKPKSSSGSSNDEEFEIIDEDDVKKSSM